MTYTLKELQNQLSKVWGKYKAFRKRPEKATEKDYKHSMDELESMAAKYDADPGKKLHSAKEEKAFLDMIKERKTLKKILESQYDSVHHPEKFFDLDDVIKDLDLED